MPYVGQIHEVNCADSCYTVQFMDAESTDMGGCWSFCMDENDVREPWLTTVYFNTILCKVVWKKCHRCSDFHMGDKQWDRITEELLSRD